MKTEPNQDELDYAYKMGLDNALVGANQVNSHYTIFWHPKTNRQWTRHEFYAILKEEVDELWDAIKRDAPTEEIEKEMIQVSAMPLRFFETSLLPQQEGRGE